MKLFSWKITQEAWEAAWAGWPPDAVVMAERFDRVVFCDKKDAPGSDWARGHLFTPAFHLAWRQLGAHLRVVIAAEEVPPQAAGWGSALDPKVLDGYRQTSQEVALWGKKNIEAPYWIELYIPHVMEAAPDTYLHPAGTVDAPEGMVSRRLLKVVTYTDPKSGTLVYHRYTGIRHAVYSEDDHDLDISRGYEIPEFKVDWWSDAS